MTTTSATPTSPAERLRAHPRRKAILDSLSPGELAALRSDWGFWARPAQLEPPGRWSAHIILAGRGWGKTRTGSQWVRQRVANGAMRIGLIAPTAFDVRAVVVEGESGLLASCENDDNSARFEPSKRRVAWRNGAIATLYSGDEPERLRGPVHDTVWIDELASVRNVRDAWDNMRLGLRLGTMPRVLCTTTPKPIQIIRDLIADPSCYVTRGSTYENRANLPAVFFDEITRLYEGSNLGRQELWAEIIEDAAGSLFKREKLDATRVKEAPPLQRVVVAIDPAATSRHTSDETGIVIAGKSSDGHLYVLDDLSGRYSPEGWATRVVDAYDEHKCDRVVAESNQGGDMIESVLRTVRPTLPYKSVHASRGKRTRAEPIAAMFEQCRAHIVGSLPQLESQLTSWDASDGSPSPDRLDAMVWALTELSKNHAPEAYGAMRQRARRAFPKRRM